MVLFILTFTSIINAQIKVTGTVIDSTNEPIEFANVVLLNKDKTEIITGTVTEKDGSFTIETDKKGVFILQISYVEFTDYNKDVTSSVDLGKIILKTNNQLDEVVIKSKAPVIKREVDRLVFNVSNSTYAIGGDLTDILKVTPGVSFINDNVSILGKNEVKIMINGRITSIPSGGLSNFLSSIPADEIKAIEVITNPPSKYEAQGNYGLINIIYKKRKNSWNSRIISRYIQTTYPAFTGGANFTYHKNKFSLFFDVNGKVGDEAVIEKSDITYPHQKWKSNTDRKDKKDYLSSRLSLQYDVSKKILIGMQYIGGVDDPDIKDVNRTKIYNQGNTIDSLIVSSGFNDVSSYKHSLNVYSDFILDTIGRKATITLDYLKYKQNQNRDFETQSLLENGDNSNIFSLSNNRSDQDINNYSAKIDITHPIKKLKLLYGGKISIIKNMNSTQFYDKTTGVPVLDNRQSDNFNYNERTQALYFSISNKINEYWSVKFGLRFENTITEGFSYSLNQTNKTSYNKLFPTAYVSYNPNKENSFSLSYGKRIKRPPFWKLNPFRWYVNDYVYGEGNPFLQPSFTDNLEFYHIYKQNFMTVAFAQFTNNGFGQVPIINANTNILRLTMQNYFKKYTYGLGFVYKLTKISWLSSFLHTQLYYTDTKFLDIDSTLLNTEQNGLTYTLENYNSITFNKSKTFFGDISFWYKSPRKTGLYFQESSYSLSFGFRALFLDKRLQTSFNAYDIFKSSNSDLTTKYNDGVIRVANVYNDNRYFVFSLSYKFGNKKIRSAKRRVGNSDEKKRI